MPLALFIEDNSEMRENIAELLELDGYEVLSAGDAEAGLSLTRSHLPDVILCDIALHGIDGYEVLQRLREDPRTAVIPLIFVTASTELCEVQKGMALGANGYIKKPFEMAELVAAIELCLMVP